jgi:hypothetical protein
MKTSELFQLLEQHKETSLWFEYAPNLLVGTNYHITEVKHVTIDAVDCGANADSWKETIIQLWESPSDLGQRDHMKSYKALGILNKVGTMKAYTADAEVKFEYSNAHFNTAQLFVDSFSVSDKKLMLHLAVEKTDCKAKDECGVPEAVGVSSEVEANCSPGGGCC